MANLLEVSGVDSCRELQHRVPANLRDAEISQRQEKVTHHAPSVALNAHRPDVLAYQAVVDAGGNREAELAAVDARRSRYGHAKGIVHNAPITGLVRLLDGFVAVLRQC